MNQPMRIGTGIDVHQLTPGRKLILGGVEIPHERGLLGHSDADVLLHAIADAMLGAAALRDIGYHFPDTDDAYLGADSLKLLQAAYQLIRQKGYCLGNVDAVILAQRPKLSPYIPEMVSRIARALEVSEDQISIKATTTEHLGFCGKEEGILATASCILFFEQEGF